jgi:hypothetical protein
MTKSILSWCKAQGYEPYTEVPAYIGSFALVDIVAINRGNEDVLVIEMKTSLSSSLLDQLRYASIIGTPWAAVLSTPRTSSLDKCKELGAGALRVVGNDVVEILKPRNARNPWAPAKQRLLDVLDVMDPGGIAGLPTLKGSGPAQLLAPSVEKFFQENENTTWEDAFAQVENHYANPRSMAGSIGPRIERT